MMRAKMHAAGVAVVSMALACAACTQAPQSSPQSSQPPQASSPQSPSSDGSMLGFTSSGAADQRKLEKQFDAMLDPADQRKWLKQLSSEPNNVGSPHDKANAEFLLAKFKEWGWDAHIEKFDVLYPTPKHISVELIAPTTYTAKLHEGPIKGDPSTALPGGLPPYNVYGADGDVTGEVVYVNYGMPDDYKELARRGIDVKGKIVIARYGAGWRGLKPLLAHQHGAIGCLIYSDPRDDGYFNADPYPKGSSRPPDGVQRGSVAKMQLGPGDPTTPGYGSVPGAKHVALEDVKTILKIPVLPISYADATPILKALGGPVAPESWRGALPFTYHIGGGPAKVHMVVESNWDRATLYDVIAKLHGTGSPDQWIIRGNHRDGWVFGAADPLAGKVAEMAEAKAMGALYKQGWRPKRTIVYASWDGEEPGLLGSTEWVETHAKELQQKAVMYLNTDGNGRGFLHVGGSPVYQQLVNQVAADVVDPETNVSVLQRQHAYIRINADSPRFKQAAKVVAETGETPLSALGSGSDFSPFYQHLGIASLSMGFGGESEGGVYHSRYDTFDHFIRFGDPTFEYGVALAQVAGRVVMRMANAQVLPMNFGDFGATLGRYVAGLHKQVEDGRAAAAQQHKLMDAGAYKLASDPLHPLAPPERLSVVPQIEFAPLDEAVKNLKNSAQAYETAYNTRVENGLDIPADQLQQINDLMGSMEQQLIYEPGLPGRAWFKNVVSAPGTLTGYAAKVIPAVHEALDGQDWDTANKQAVVTAKVLDGYSAQLDKLTASLKKQ